MYSTGHENNHKFMPKEHKEVYVHICTAGIKNASTARHNSMYEVPYCFPTIGILFLFTILPGPPEGFFRSFC